MSWEFIRFTNGALMRSQFQLNAKGSGEIHQSENWFFNCNIFHGCVTMIEIVFDLIYSFALAHEMKTGAQISINCCRKVFWYLTQSYVMEHFCVGLICDMKANNLFNFIYWIILTHFHFRTIFDIYLMLFNFQYTMTRTTLYHDIIYETFILPKA